MGGISLIVTTIFLVSCIIVQSGNNSHKTRNGLIVLAAFLILCSSLLILNSNSEILPLPNYRYLNAINPFLTTTDPLVDSVSEHATTTLAQSFLFNSVLMIFAGMGVWLIIKNTQTKKSFIKNDLLSFTLIFGMMGIYVSSAFVRLELFASLSVIILSSLGIIALTKEFVAKNPSSLSPLGKSLKIPFFIGIIFLLILPLIYPEGSTTFSLSDTPPTILNGGTTHTVATNDWLHAMSWIKNNTNEKAVIASWWDYGYWIQTLGERATLADNSTLSTEIIQNIARMLLGLPDKSWNDLNGMQADYVLIFVATNKLNLGTSESLYTIGGGGDESKKQWFMRIGGLPESNYVHIDDLSGTNSFWNETLLGQMIPYTILGYVNPNNVQQQSPTYIPGMVAIYERDIKFPADGDGPLRLAYSSPSFENENVGAKLGIFIYEVNKDYIPNS